MKAPVHTGRGSSSLQEYIWEISEWVLEAIMRV